MARHVERSAPLSEEVVALVWPADRQAARTGPALQAVLVRSEDRLRLARHHSPANAKSMLLQNHRFFYDDMQNAAEQEKHDAIDLNDPPGMDSDEDTLQQLTDGAANHNGQVSGFGLQHQVKGDSIIFHLVANDGVNPKVYIVRVDLEDDRYMCSCNMFEMCGLICPHIIRVMVHLNVQTISATYMLERWSKRTIDVAPDPGDGHRAMHFGVPTTNTLKFNSLCRKFGKLASDACFSDEAYNFVLGLINQGIVGVAAMKSRARDGVRGVGEAQGREAAQQVHASIGPVTCQQEQTFVGLRNPPKSAKKGRPKEKEKRRKTLIELREDEMRKKAKKDEAKTKKAPKPRGKKTPCNFCGDEDHKAKSCKFLADMLAASAATNVPDVETVITL
ncbi:Protein FAR1-RELATED SEQUENCE 3 [Hordeum vulgare]|nr:Protein FAR1-RELATED SEQUENCE 3 [Hordeum vulgare]